MFLERDRQSLAGLSQGKGFSIPPEEEGGDAAAPRQVMAGAMVHGTCGSGGAWALALFNLLLSVPVREVFPRCLSPPQGLGSLSSARAEGSGRLPVAAASGAPVPGRGLPGLPGDMGDTGLAPSGSGGVKCLGPTCSSWFRGLMGPWGDGTMG